MTQVQRVHSGDIFIAAVVVISQVVIVRLLVKDWKERLSPRAFRLIMVALRSVWAIIAFGIVENFIFNAHRDLLPPVVRSFLSASEILWGILSTSAIFVYLAFRFFLRRLPVDHAPERRRLIQAAGVAAMAAPVVLCGFGAFIERTRFRVTEVDLPIPGLHPDLEGFRVAQISDLHISPYLSVRDAARVVDMTNELRPRLTLVTGDLITDIGDPLDATIAELGRLRADAGVLGCLGNHEVYAECELYTTLQARRVGIEFLRGQAHRVHWGSGALNIAGVDFQPFRHKNEYLRGADKLIVPGVSNLLLSHNPDVFPVAVNQGYDAVIAGHTHGGQVTVEILRQTLNFARFFTPYVAGLYRMNGRSCYVTTGIGTIGMPVRVGAAPEISLLRLRRA